MTTIIILYYLSLNVLGFVLMGVDKEKAKKHKWRIPEQQLLTLVLLGGGVGVWSGMRFFHHKTRHTKFTIGIPFLLLIHIGVVIYMSRVL
ncbi:MULTISPECIES: DUF1294 domain-containing protein [unclassified Virgibacillus]|uniref:DUF1294 domain-containing protein n=1 Tax=unclassified Virgibacillus TaxID=2620237 RepID=UPI0024DE7961|nr:DUF1294 domain-containing protein [Virgibacillus sp. LDC-1]